MGRGSGKSGTIPADMSRRQPFIQVNDLTKHFGNVVALDGVYFEVVEGETFTILGPSGSGMTTLFHLLLGLKRPTRGTAEVLGFDCLSESVDVRKRVGCVLGSQRFHQGLTGREYLELSVAAHQSKELRRSELVERLEINESEKIGNVSEAEATRLAWVLALLHNPTVLLLDNPFHHLDESSRRVMFNLLEEERSKGTTILLTTDSPRVAARHSDRVGTLVNGELTFVRDMSRLNRKLGRKLRIVFREDMELQDFIVHNLSVVSRNGREWVITLDGEAGSLLKRLGKYSVEDVEIVEDVMEDILMDMMRGRGPGPYV